MAEFTLRPWREADAASIARYADNAKIARPICGTCFHGPTRIRMRWIL